MNTILRLQINGFCLIAIVILRFSGDRRRSSRSDGDLRLFRALLASTAAMLIFDSCTWLFDGRPGASSRLANNLASVFYYAVHTLPIALFILYADFQIFRDESRFVRVSRPLVAIEVLVAVGAVLSPFAGILFTIDPGNYYRRGAWFPAFAATQFGLVAYVLGHVLLNAKRVSRRVFITLLAYPLPMLAASIVQMLFFGLVLLWPTMTLFLIAAASNIENRRAKTDYLTGTANRRSLDEELERRIGLSKSGKALCGLMIDVDDFKAINDRFGHEEGDRALEDVAHILKSSVRIDDHVARLGGDEFVVLVDFKELEAMEELVRRIERAVANQNRSARRPYSLSLSIGRTTYDRVEGGGPETFLACLDADMYSRKRLKATGAAG